MNRKILKEDTAPRRSGDAHVPLVVFVVAAVWAVGATLLRLALRGL